MHGKPNEQLFPRQAVIRPCTGPDQNQNWTHDLLQKGFLFNMASL